MAEWQFAGFALDWLPAEYASNSAPRGRKAGRFFFWRIGGLVTVVESLQHETKPSNNVGKAIINHPPNHQK